MKGGFYKIKLFVIVFALFSIGTLFTVPVYGHLMVDQSFEGPFENVCSVDNNPVWQSFTPTQKFLGAVDVFLLRGGFTGPADHTVEIFEGTFIAPGALLGSQTVSVPAAAGETLANPKIVHFDFGTAIPLIPGNTYSIKFTGSDSINPITFSDLYAGGSLTCLILGLIEFGDMGFRTYFEEGVCPGDFDLKNIDTEIGTTLHDQATAVDEADGEADGFVCIKEISAHGVKHVIFVDNKIPISTLPPG